MGGNADLSAVPIAKGHYTDGEGDTERIFHLAVVRKTTTLAPEQPSAWFVYGIGTGLFSLYFEPGLVHFMADKFHYLPFRHFTSEGFNSEQITVNSDRCRICSRMPTG